MAASAGKEQRGRGKPFQPGQSGNPAGRRPGTRNRATLAAQTLLEGEAEALARKAVELALGGDTVALRLCLARLLPPARERSLPDGAVMLPPLRAANLAQASAAVLRAVAAGRLTPAEGQAMASLLAQHGKNLELVEIEKRLAALEAGKEIER